MSGLDGIPRKRHVYLLNKQKPEPALQTFLQYKEAPFSLLDPSQQTRNQPFTTDQQHGRWSVAQALGNQLH